MKEGSIVDEGTTVELIKKHGRHDLEEVFLKLARQNED
jgi:ABC-type Na+ transport system ATPase subunit NatA